MKSMTFVLIGCFVGSPCSSSQARRMRSGRLAYSYSAEQPFDARRNRLTFFSETKFCRWLILSSFPPPSRIFRGCCQLRTADAQYAFIDFHDMSCPVRGVEPRSRLGGGSAVELHRYGPCPQKIAIFVRSTTKICDYESSVSIAVTSVCI